MGRNAMASVLLTLVILGLSFEFSETELNVFTADGDPVEPGNLDAKHQLAFQELKAVAAHAIQVGEGAGYQEFVDQSKEAGKEVLVSEEEFKQIHDAYKGHGQDPFAALMALLDNFEGDDDDDQF